MLLELAEEAYLSHIYQFQFPGTCLELGPEKGKGRQNDRPQMQDQRGLIEGKEVSRTLVLCAL
jgi:hypothetical protein